MKSIEELEVALAHFRDSVKKIKCIRKNCGILTYTQIKMRRYVA